jgi:hypothetical protein
MQTPGRVNQTTDRKIYYLEKEIETPTMSSDGEQAHPNNRYARFIVENLP